jgi:hypothetical protein
VTLCEAIGRTGKLENSGLSKYTSGVEWQHVSSETSITIIFHGVNSQKRIIFAVRNSNLER